MSVVLRAAVAYWVLLLGVRLIGRRTASQMAAWMVIFFFSSTAASSAYLTTSEIFPLETRALALAFSTPSALLWAGSWRHCSSAC